ncbi:hypothetical protein [Janthinobacterium sp. 344]|uniref:hypothetical protein n=1 Tax=Janthinobacterium sp. 344 TaxID=1566280 RepID=UPI001C315ABE|nr:hypothetical protein [Janthinobacterium sp. 344]
MCNFRYRGITDTRKRKAARNRRDPAQNPGEKNAKAGTAIVFHLRLSFVLRISQWCFFFFMAIPGPATTQAALAGRGKVWR